MNDDFINIEYLTKSNIAKSDEIWIFPTGNISDYLMLKSILYTFNHNYPNYKFKMVKRTYSLKFFEKVPSIIEFGFPTKNSKIIKTDYWTRSEYIENKKSSYQVLAKMFGLDIPIIEKIIFDYSYDSENLFNYYIPWKKFNILIAPFAEFPNITMHPIKWDKIIKQLLNNETLILQIGNISDIHIKGSYSLLGLTDINTIIAILKKVQLIITSENYLIQLASLLDIPTLVLLGPSQKTAQTFQNQIKINSPLFKYEKCDECRNIIFSKKYLYECPYDEQKCIDNISEKEVIIKVNSFLNY